MKIVWSVSFSLGTKPCSYWCCCQIDTRKMKPAKFTCCGPYCSKFLLLSAVTKNAFFFTWVSIFSSCSNEYPWHDHLNKEQVELFLHRVKKRLVKCDSVYKGTFWSPNYEVRVCALQNSHLSLGLIIILVLLRQLVLFRNGASVGRRPEYYMNT